MVIRLIHVYRGWEYDVGNGLHETVDHKLSLKGVALKRYHL